MSTVKATRTKKRISDVINAAPSGIEHLLPKGDLAVLTAIDLGLSKVEVEFLQKYSINLSEAPVEVVSVHERMLKYKSMMGPNVVIYDPREGAQNQLFLFQTFMRALSQQDNSLFMAVDVIIGHIREGLNDVFSSRMAYRFIKNIQRDGEEVNSYLKILEILLLVADPTKRAGVVSRGIVRGAVSAIDPRYKDAAFSLVTYLSQDHS